MAYPVRSLRVSHRLQSKIPLGKDLFHTHKTVGRILFLMGCRFEGLGFLLTVGQRSP